MMSVARLIHVHDFEQCLQKFILSEKHYEKGTRLKEG